jgi:hypothetical protein
VGGRKCTKPVHQQTAYVSGNATKLRKSYKQINMSSPTKVATFQIQKSFNLTGRGLVILGQLTGGSVKIGDYLTFTHDNKPLTFMISRVETADNTYTKEYWVGLTFVYQNEQQKLEFEKIKVTEQLADVTTA